MDSLKLLEASESLMEKSAEMAENDPHGFIITIVSVSVVFAALIILYFAYTIIGKVANWKTDRPVSDLKEDKTCHSDPSPEVAAAISLALHEYMNDRQHDRESYVITIKRNQNKQ